MPVQRGLRRAGGRLSPKGVDELLPRHDLLAMQEQHRKQRALLRARRGEIAATVDDPERTEDLELHLHRIVARVTSELAAHNPRVSRVLDRDRRRWPYSSTTAPTGRFELGARRRVRVETYGHDLGQNSWLTIDEWQRAIASLALRPGSTVLDVACGAGGPTSTSTGTTGAPVVGIDIHPDAIETAAEQARREGLAERPASSTWTRAGRCRSSRRRSTPWSASTRSTIWPTGRRCCAEWRAC